MDEIFKKGDRAYHYLYKWGTIRNANKSFASIDFDGIGYAMCDVDPLSFTEYTLEGFSQERPEPLPNPGDIVWVRDNEYDNWMITYFRKFNANVILRYGCNPRNSADSMSIYYYKYLTTKNPYEND
jgi:hypothetical protein